MARFGSPRNWSRDFRRKLGIQLYAPQDIPKIKRVEEKLISRGQCVDSMTIAIGEYYKQQQARSDAAKRGWRKRRQGEMG